jgi:hypothetical protein
MSPLRPRPSSHPSSRAGSAHPLATRAPGRRRLLLASLTLALLAALGADPAHAHTNEELAKVIGPHGGQMRATAVLHLELVVRPGELLVYVTDHADKPLSTRGASGRAVLLFGAERTETALEPFGANGLRATGRFPVDPKLRAVVSVTLAGGKPQQERFEPFNPKATAAAKGMAAAK